LGSNDHHVIWAGVLALVIFLAIAGALTWAEHVRAEATRDAEIKASKVEVERLKTEIQKEAEAFKRQYDALEKQKQEVKTAPQAVRIIHDTIPLSQPITMLDKPKDAAPDAPSATLNDQQLIELSKHALSCKQCELNLAKDESELEKKDKIIAQDKVQLDDAIKQSKGGSYFQRLRRNTKWFGWGALIGGVIVATMKH
jgi:hypothetical protein